MRGLRGVTPLPMRNGLGPARLVLPAHAGGLLLDFLEGFRPGEPWRARAAVGEVVDRRGAPATALTPARPHAEVFHYRDPAPEVPVPFPLEVLHRDAGIVVVDKPHFLATIPRGQHVTETALVRLRAMTGVEALVPAHRLDRMTAGVLLFVADPALRRPYQELFATGRVRKTYEAVARHDPGLVLPTVVRTRIVKEHGVMTARTEAGEPNSETLVEVAAVRGGRALYRLVPRTGRTHQLRLHMAGLGVPIEGDNYYPEYRPEQVPDFARPLRLLARSIEFADPVTGGPRRFASSRSLEF